jgi:hypothetical protein
MHAPNHGSSYENGNNLGYGDSNYDAENDGVIIKSKEDKKPIHGASQTFIEVVETTFCFKTNAIDVHKW